MHFRNLGLSLALGAGLVSAGCGGGDDKSDGLTVPPAPAAQAPSVEVSASSAATADPAASLVAPPPDTQAPASIAPAAPLKNDDLLGGDGRPLTEEEQMLLNYGVDMFKEEKGRFPANLQEAVASRHIARLPKLPPGEEFNYDPVSGRVTIIKK